MENHKNRWLNDWVKSIAQAVLGAIITTLALGLLQYIGAHIPDLLMFVTKVGGALGAVRFSNRV